MNDTQDIAQDLALLDAVEKADELEEEKILLNFFRNSGIN